MSKCFIRSFNKFSLNFNFQGGPAKKKKKGLSKKVSFFNILIWLFSKHCERITVIKLVEIFKATTVGVLD